MATKSKLIIQVPKDLLDRVDDYRLTHRKHSRAETVREFLDYALTLPPLPSNHCCLAEAPLPDHK